MAKQNKRLLAILTAVLLAALLFAPAAQAAANDCATKYPIVLVHGAGFSDMNVGINYWGRIPELLEARGAKIFYGGTDGWGSVEDGAAILKATVNKVLKQTGSAKVNLIAHSKGGLESRYMISSLGMADKVASLTTISTPHGGSMVMDEILGVPDFLMRGASLVVNVTRKIAGDQKPDFYSGTQSFGTEQAKAFNKKNPDMPGVYYQSFAGMLYAPASDIILSIPGYWIKSVDGPNDGMVTVESAKWGNFRGVIRGAGYRGVSHADEVDLRRTDIEIQPLLGAKTVTGVYPAMVAELKKMGY
ncbi:MAG: triacylglycerol lipase [Firmicutes bacterium]|nr:triacylglycerol lipase [Bacillota bacterium]